MKIRPKCVEKVSKDIILPKWKMLSLEGCILEAKKSPHGAMNRLNIAEKRFPKYMHKRIPSGIVFCGQNDSKKLPQGGQQRAIWRLFGIKDRNKSGKALKGSNLGLA